MSEEYDMKAMKKNELMELCKTKGLKNYSKRKKDEVIALLEGIGMKNVPKPLSDLTKKVMEDNAKKRAARAVALNIKLEKNIDMAPYKKQIASLTKDTTDETIMEMLQEKVDEFIQSDVVDNGDRVRYLHKYGPFKAYLEYMTANPKTKFEKMEEEEIYRTLSIFIYKTDMSNKVNLIKKVRRTIKEKDEAAKKVEEKSKTKVTKPTKDKVSKDSKTTKAKADKKVKKDAKVPDEDVMEEDGDEDDDEDEDDEDPSDSDEE